MYNPSEGNWTKNLSIAFVLYSGGLAVKYTFWEVLLYIEVLHNFCIPWGGWALLSLTCLHLSLVSPSLHEQMFTSTPTLNIFSFPGQKKRLSLSGMANMAIRHVWYAWGTSCHVHVCVMIFRNRIARWDSRKISHVGSNMKSRFTQNTFLRSTTEQLLKVFLFSV